MRVPSGKSSARDPRAWVLTALPLNLVVGWEYPQKRNRLPGQRRHPHTVLCWGVGPTPHHVVGIGDVYAHAVRIVKAPVPLGGGLDGVGLVRHGGLRQAAEPVQPSCRHDLRQAGGMARSFLT